MDSHTELLIQEAIARLVRNRTTLIIAHRLSTVRRADQIIGLEGGRVVEMGNHQELMALNGLYRGMVRAQELALEGGWRFLVIQFVNESAEDLWAGADEGLVKPGPGFPLPLPPPFPCSPRAGPCPTPDPHKAFVRPRPQILHHPFSCTEFIVPT